MKKMFIAAGMATVMTPMMAENVSFADEIRVEINESRSTNSQVGIVDLSSSTSLNIRASHGLNHKIVGKIPGGKKVTVLEKVDGWYKVEYNGVKGYSSSQYIKIGNETINNQVSATSKSGKVVNLNGAKLNIRKGASTSYDIIGKLKEGDTVDILEKTNNNWYKIKVANSTGYVYGNYIRESNGVSAPQTNGIVSIESSNVGKIATVTASSLNVRSGYGVSYSVVSKVSRGSNVQIVEVYSNGWSKVKLNTGIVGYVDASYLNDYRTGSLNSSVTDSNNTQTNQSNKVSEVINLAKSKLGCPYVWGAEGPNSFDCSGFTYYVYKNAAGITLPRTSSAQASAGRAISKSQLQPGDLVFFNTSGSGISHVGLYIGNNEMIHSPSSGKTVSITKINSSYYSSRFVTARRIIG